jgi:hypothetical protein
LTELLSGLLEVFLASAYLCKEQRVTTTTKRGASFSTEVAKPDVLPSNAGAPSVLYFPVKFLLGKREKHFSVSRTSTAFVVSKRDSQNKNYSIMSGCIYRNKHLATLKDVYGFIQLHTEGQ